MRNLVQAIHAILFFFPLKTFHLTIILIDFCLVLSMFGRYILIFFLILLQWFLAYELLETIKSFRNHRLCLGSFFVGFFFEKKYILIQFFFIIFKRFSHSFFHLFSWNSSIIFYFLYFFIIIFFSDKKNSSEIINIPVTYHFRNTNNLLINETNTKAHTWLC